MTFTINVSRTTAPAQFQILQALARAKPALCQLGNGNKTATLHGIYLPGKRVLDVIRYGVVIPANGPTTLQPISAFFPCEQGLGKYGDQLAGELRGYERIVLVIESPHEDEFGPNFVPIAPAQGETGIGVENLFGPLIDNPGLSTHAKRLGLKAGTYELIICNPVRYQASLHSLHGRPLNGNNSSGVPGLRNRVWRTLYRDYHERRSFLERLSIYLPSAVLVACTSGLKREVYQDVKTWVETACYPVNAFVATHHPCVWSRNTTFK